MLKIKYPYLVREVDPEEMDVLFIVEFFDFPGIIGGGNTVDEALKIANEAKDMYIESLNEEGKEIPNPTDFNVSGRVTLRLPKTLHFKSIQEAKKENVSLNTFITDAVSERVYGSYSVVSSVIFNKPNQYNDKTNSSLKYFSVLDNTYSETESCIEEGKFGYAN